MALYTCRRCLRHNCCCPRYADKHVIETADTTVTVETRERNLPDPLDTEAPEPKDITYKVVPHDFASAYPHRTGTVYQIVQQRYLASSKDPKAAQHIVDRLNSVRELERKLERARNTAEVLRLRSPGSVESVREAMIQEVIALPHARWSSPREQIKSFGTRVLKRLHKLHTGECEPNTDIGC